MSAETTVLSTSYYRDLSSETDLPSKLHKELQETLPDIILEGVTEELEEKLTEPE